jgi:hypothetical protein
MQNRINIAGQIYKGLILQDLQASIKNPMINAQRALLFADALLICAAPTTHGDSEECSMEVAVTTQGNDADQAILVRAAKAKFALSVEGRRGSGRPAIH